MKRKDSSLPGMHCLDKLARVMHYVCGADHTIMPIICLLPSLPFLLKRMGLYVLARNKYQMFCNECNMFKHAKLVCKNKYKWKIIVAFYIN